jgi:hypothetical protein
VPDFRRAPKLLMAPKVLVVDFRPAAVPADWFTSDDLTQQYIAAMRQVSGNKLVYQVVNKQEVAKYPVLLDGRQYTNVTWAQAQADDSKAFRDAHGNYMLADYQRIIQDFNILQQVFDNQIDEVWMFGGPYFGFYESRMVGNGAFWCNGPGIEQNCRRFVIMGFNYQRSVKEMVHDFGHRTESILARQYGSQNYLQLLYSAQPPAPSAMPSPRNDFERFLLANGTVHRKPGGADYGQDEIAWVSALKPDWFTPTVNPNKAK